MPLLPSQVGRTFDVALEIHGESVHFTFAWTVAANEAFARAVDWSDEEPTVEIELATDLMRATMVDWQGIQDESGAPLCFSPQAFAERVPPIYWVLLRREFLSAASGLVARGN